MSTVRNAWLIWHTNVCGVSPFSSGPVGNFRPYKVGTTEEKMRSPSLGITQEFIGNAGNAGHVMPPVFFLPDHFSTSIFSYHVFWTSTLVLRGAGLFICSEIVHRTNPFLFLFRHPNFEQIWTIYIYIDIDKLTSRKWDGYVSKPFKTLIACCWARCLFAMVP